MTLTEGLVPEEEEPVAEYIEPYWKFWKTCNGASVEKQMNHVEPIGVEITEAEFDAFITDLPTPTTPVKTDVEKLVDFAKTQGWI